MPNHEAPNVSPRICPICGETFTPYRDYQRACSRRCREKLPDYRDRARQYTSRPEVRERKNSVRRVDANPDRREVNRRGLLWRKYGITPDQYDEMFAAQNGVCALCAQPADPNGVRAASRLHVDHDHETGKVRALLCNHCNRGIGAFRDDPDLMQRASLYVWKHRQQT